MKQNFTLENFAEPITALPDTPALPANELKRRFQAPTDELRQAHNALAGDHERLSGKVDGIIAETFPDAIREDMLTPELSGKLNAKADQSALAAEIQAREALAQTVAKKCEVHIGTYIGNGKDQRLIDLGFQPIALMVIEHGYLWNMASGDLHGAFALLGHPVRWLGQSHREPALEIVENGFRVINGEGVQLNASTFVYCYLAFCA